MADLKTTNIFGDAYINNKVGIATNAPATRLQIGQLSPTAATEGLQFGDDTGARLYRGGSSYIQASAGFQAGAQIYASTYLQSGNSQMYPNSYTSTQRFGIGNASGNAWIDGLTIAQGGNVTVYNNLTTPSATISGYITFPNDTSSAGLINTAGTAWLKLDDAYGNMYIVNNQAGAGIYFDSNAYYWRAANGSTSLMSLSGNGDLGAARYLSGTYVNTSDDVSTGNISHIVAKFGDNYHRSATAAKVAAFISGQTMNIVGTSTNITAYTINQNVGTANSPTFAGLTVAGGNATIYRDLIVNGGASNPYGNRIIVQGTATTYTLQDSTLRPTVYLNGDYPVITLNATATTNANHGPTLQFAFNGLTTGGATSRQIVIGANGVGSWLDFGFSGGANGDNSSYNPHNGISGYNGVTAMRLFSNGLLVGSTGAYPNNITSISYALDVRGTGYFSSTLTVGGNISAANLSGTNTGDQTIGNGTITIAAGTGIGVGTSNTFTMNQSGATTVTVTNNGVTSLAGTTNRITVSAGTGGVTLNLPQDIHTGASPTFAGLSLTSVSTTGATITNLTGAYQNTTVYDSPRTQSATPSRGIRAPASSIQFTDSYAIAPFYTYRSTGDWPVPYGIGWGTGGESSGIFQRYASNGSSFGDMIFYTGNDGSGAFSFRRHTWEGNTYFAAGSGELNTELFRIDWAGNVSIIGGFTISHPGSGYAQFSNWVKLGTSGFFSDTNSAHIYPNNASYGSWRMDGTRNGWGGIEFGNNGVSLMMGSDTVGFHQNTNGWLFRVHNGSGFIYKGSWGGGTSATILDSSNYTSYTPGLGTNNTLTGINVINNTSNTLINNQSGNLGLTMFQSTAGTDAYMTFHIGGDYAAYLGLGGAENDLVYGGWSAGNNRHRILHSGNSPYAWNMNQYVRTTDSPTFNTVTANITGNAYNNLSNDYKDIYVYGDVNTYYVVLIQGEYLYSFGRYSVTRGYNWTGPDTWNVATHKGGLTLDWEWSGDTAWGGNDKAIRIIEFNESYSTMVAGLGYPVNGGVIIWLRGGGVNGALYRIRTPVGSNATVTVYDNLSIANHVASTTFTAADSTVFSTRANTNNVSAEILARYPVRGAALLYNENNAVLHAGNYNSYSPTLTGTGASGTWSINVTGNAATATTLQTARNINGTSFNGSAAITTATWGTARTLTIGSTGKSVDGSAAITWSLAEIGAAATNQTMFIGTTSVAINRSSASQTLTGVSIDGSAASATFLNSSNYINRCGSSGNANTDFQNTPAGSVRHNGDDANLTNSPGGTWWFYDNYRHSNNSNYWGIQVAWGWEDQLNKLATRNISGGSFGGWVYYLNSANYTDYTVTKTGTGASGTWGINITGNAATATTATNVSIANGSIVLAKIENITAYTILGNSNASAAATPAALSVATVATMLSGQTMNIAGSSTSISGFNNPATAATANTIAYRDANGDLSARYFFGSYQNSSDDINTGNISHIMAKFGDNYHRSATAAKVAAFISGQTMNIAGSSTSCTGNAATATNATTAGGLAVQSGTNYDANKIVRTDGNGYILAGWINTISGDNGTTAIDRVYASQDGYIRYYTPANFRTVLDVPTRNGSGVTNFGINTAPSNRLHINGDGTNPAIRVDNGAVVLAASAASNSKTFYGWLPISIAGTTKWIQMYN
jgi:hypothetical protein